MASGAATAGFPMVHEPECRLHGANGARTSTITWSAREQPLLLVQQVSTPIVPEIATGRWMHDHGHWPVSCSLTIDQIRECNVLFGDARRQFAGSVVEYECDHHAIRAGRPKPRARREPDRRRDCISDRATRGADTEMKRRRQKRSALTARRGDAGRR